MNIIKVIAEFLGTFLFVLTVFASGGNALWIGGALVFIILMIGNISGGLINPAISAAMYFSGSLAFNEMISYIIVQIVAGVLAFGAYNYIVNK